MGSQIVIRPDTVDIPTSIGFDKTTKSVVSRPPIAIFNRLIHNNRLETETVFISGMVLSSASGGAGNLSDPQS
jgi:hypothetical protein